METIKEQRAAFQADFERAASAREDAECLTSEEILSLQRGMELDPVAAEHLTHCSLCSALRQTLEVDQARIQEFRQFVQATQPAQTGYTPATHDRRQPLLGWRFPVAAIAAFFSLATLVAMQKHGALKPSVATATAAAAIKVPPELQIPGGGLSDSRTISNQVQIELQPPSGPPLQFVSTSPTTVKDVAPQVATAAILSQSAMTLPVNSPPQLTAEVKQEASDIVYRWLAPAGADGASFKNSAGVEYLPAEKSYQLTLSGGKASLVVPEMALEDGRTLKAFMLGSAQVHRAISSLADESRPINMKLTDGYVLNIGLAKP